jgi:hypothetical protein
VYQSSHYQCKYRSRYFLHVLSGISCLQRYLPHTSHIVSASTGTYKRSGAERNKIDRGQLLHVFACPARTEAASLLGCWYYEIIFMAKKWGNIIRHFNGNSINSSRSSDIHWTKKLYTLINYKCSLSCSRRLTNRRAFLFAV